MNNLNNNLLNPSFSKDKEEIFNYKLFYDIKISGLKRGLDFEISQPIIDNKGYDLILSSYEDGRNNIRRFQLKTVSKKSKTKSWWINKSFFKPNEVRDLAMVMPNANADNIGNYGGVILIEYDANEENIQSVNYYYTDFMVTTLFHHKILKYKGDIMEFYKNLFTDDGGKISLKKGMFVKVTIDQLLELSTFYPFGYKDINTWKFFYYGNTFDREQTTLNCNS